MEQMQPESSRQIGTLIGIVKFFTIPIPTKFLKVIQFYGITVDFISSHNLCRGSDRFILRWLNCWVQQTAVSSDSNSVTLIKSFSNNWIA